MRILVITSCTGHKSVSHEHALTLDDFRRGAAHVRSRERELKSLLTAAEDLYTGQQHVRLMRGVEAFRQKHGRNAVDLQILSAGYGLVPGERKLAPYEATFQGMKKGELRTWADTLGVPAAFRAALARPYDLALVLLGDEYLDACALDDEVTYGGPAILFCGGRTLKRLKNSDRLRLVPLGNADARRYSCALVSLKGELGSKILERAAKEDEFLSKLATSGETLALLDEAPKAPSTRSAARANPKVDQVISIPKEWWNKPHREKLRYFIPEWDDLVDPDFDFENEAHSGGAADWQNEVYAHQLYSEPNYDGILVSREVVKKRKKKERVDALGIHRFLRVPRTFPIMGDCGAFGYIMEDVPPYSTADVIDYYTRLDFDYGVSVDHLIVAATEQQKRQRYDLTIQNAEDFLNEHRRHGLQWEPIGAVQGWDPSSYSEAARRYVAMGYRYIALGGLVRTNTAGIIRVLDEVRRVVPDSVQMHLFGIARLDGITEFVKRGVRSIDNASMLRKAWLGSEMNYLTDQGWYSAIRIPEAKAPDVKGGSFRAKKLIDSGSIAFEELRRLEQACLSELRLFASHDRPVPSSLLDHLVAYDELVAGARRGTRERLHRTLSERPWAKCPCDICQRWGVEVVIFRGNNRNRRRGFHNTFVFYEMLQRAIQGEYLGEHDAAFGDVQRDLFAAVGGEA